MLPRPHKAVTAKFEQESLKQDELLKEPALYLISQTKQSESSRYDKDRIQALESEVRSLRTEISRMGALLQQKDVLLQNNRVREQELKLSLLKSR